MTPQPRLLRDDRPVVPAYLETTKAISQILQE
jgi:hypothetical protein